MAEKVEIKVMGYRCERCNHEWIPRNDKNSPRVCPKCKSPYWDKPRKNKLGTTTNALIKKLSDNGIKIDEILRIKLHLNQTEIIYSSGDKQNCVIAENHKIKLTELELKDLEKEGVIISNKR